VVLGFVDDLFKNSVVERNTCDLCVVFVLLGCCWLLIFVVYFWQRVKLFVRYGFVVV